MNKPVFICPQRVNVLLKIPLQDDLLMQQGDIAFFPYEIKHSLCQSSRKTEAHSRVEYPQAKNVDGTDMLCGSFNFEHLGISRVLGQQPRYFIIKNNHETPWINALLELIIAESHASNSSVILNRLCELLFMQSLRHYLNSAQNEAGFMSVYSNQKLHAAIQAIHDQPEKPWSLEELAILTHMSRSAFSSHFKFASGWTAMQYLTWWRMQLAWQKLRDGQSVSSVSLEVGYQSDASFSRAFKREFSVNVGQVRKGTFNTKDS